MTVPRLIPADLGFHVPIATMDCETYSEAGYVWQPDLNRWGALPHASQGRKGLKVVGMARYAEHESTDVLCWAYDLADGAGVHHWRPGMPNPGALFEHIAAGRLIEAWNAPFEWVIWTHVMRRRYGWPELPYAQLRCAMAKARAAAWPGALGEAGDAMGLMLRKDKEGERLLNKLSVPRNPTKADPRTRITPDEEPVDGPALYRYNITDVGTEKEASHRTPDLTGADLRYWQCDQAINRRGIAIDLQGLADCTAIVEAAHQRYNAELFEFTGIDAASKTQQIIGWLAGAGNLRMSSLDEDAVDEALKKPDLGWAARRVLEIRQAIGSAAVKKLYAMANQMCSDGRLRDLFSFNGARTGRPTGNGPQPTNLPNSGPDVWKCAACSKHYGSHLNRCAWCGHARVPLPPPADKPGEWNRVAAAEALQLIRHRSLDAVEAVYGNAMATVAGCLRGLFVAAPGHDLICSDYSAIEAVTLAELAGCEWRRQVFHTHGKIYEVSGARVFGLDEQEVLDYKRRTGMHHPVRKKGKINELANGYGGWINSMRTFGAEGTDDELKAQILAWRDASPEIPELWGGQPSWRRDEYWGVEGAFVSAILDPGRWHYPRLTREVSYGTRQENSTAHGARIGHLYLRETDTLYVRLLSGRLLYYRRPRLEASTRQWREGTYEISFEGYNTNPKNGPPGWVRMNTYGPRLVENYNQATANCVLRAATIACEEEGYPIVQHVYDELCAEVPQGFGSVEAVEAIMMRPLPWAQGWPIKAAGGWREKRYGK